MLRHDLTNGRHLTPAVRERQQQVDRTSPCASFNRVCNDLNQKLVWRSESLAPMTDARKRLLRKLAITLLLINIERLEELDRLDEENALLHAHNDRLALPAAKTPAAFRRSPVHALESYSIKNAKPSRHSESPSDRRPIDPSPVADDVLEEVEREEIWHRKPKKTLSWRVKPSDIVRHNNAKAVVGDRKKLKRQAFAIDQLDANLIARVTTV